MPRQKTLPRFFYIILTTGSRIFTIFSTTRNGKYINRTQIIRQCKKVEAIKKELIILNIHEFKQEQDLIDFIS